MAEFSDSSSFAPSHVIVLSELPAKEKEAYYDLLLAQDAKFFEDRDSNGDPRHMANMRILAPGIKKDAPKKSKATKKGLDTREKLRRVASKSVDELKASLKPISVDAGDGTLDELDLSLYPRISAYLTPAQTLGDSASVGAATAADALAAGGSKVVPKRRPLVWVMKLIEEIYDSRYTQDIADLQKEETADRDTSDRDTNLFPVFVIAHISKRYGLKSLVEQTAWDLLYSVSVMRKDSLEIEIFARFLQELYDPDDILFFMYLRSVTQKILGMQFKSRWSSDKMVDSRSSQQQLWLSYRECVTVARTVFGNDGEDDADAMYHDFLQNIDSQVVGQKKRQGSTTTDTRRIEVTQLFHLAVAGYHEARPEEDSSTATGFTSAAATPRTVDQVLTGPELEALFREYQRRMQMIDDADDKAGTRVDDRLKIEIRRQEMEKALRQVLESKAGFDILSERESTFRDWAAQMLQMNGELDASTGGGGGGGGANERPDNSYGQGSVSPQGELSPQGGVQNVQEAAERAFVEQAMQHAEGLPDDVKAQIQEEVAAQLHSKIDDKLQQLGDLSNLRDAEMEMVMERILATPDVGQAIESLVSALTNYAINHPELS
jgi:hypothetical protein